MSDWNAEDIDRLLVQPLLDMAQELRRLGKKIGPAAKSGDIPKQWVPLNDGQMFSGLVHLDNFRKELSRKLEDGDSRRLWRSTSKRPPKPPQQWPPQID